MLILKTSVPFPPFENKKPRDFPRLVTSPQALAVPGISGFWFISVFIVTFWGKVCYLYCLIVYYIYLLFVKFFLAFPFCVGKISFMGERKMFSNRIDEDLVKELKHLAIDENRPLGILLEESIRDLLKKYDKKPAKPKK
jgi:hypothetical protein